MGVMTGLNIQSLAHLGRGLERGAYQKGKLYSRRRIGCQEVKLLSVLRTKIASLFSLPSCPLNFCSSDNDPLPCPPPREGACSRKFNQQSNACHCERQNGASQSHNLYNINEITTSNASHSPRNDIENSCKTQVVDGTATFPRNDIENSCKTHVPGAAATLPHRGEGISKKLLKHRGQSDVRKILKQVQDDRNISLKPTDSLINLFSYSPRKRCAFTLAEVLITLGIIGVVAAMTMPVLISNYRKSVVETRLAKVYSTMNQAIKMAEADYGDVSGWEKFETLYEKDENGNNDTSKPIPNTEYFNKYFRPYISPLKIDDKERSVKVYFQDGSLFSFGPSSMIFYPDAKNYEKEVDEDGNITEKSKKDRGKTSFTFYFNPTDNTTNNKYHYGKGIEPYKVRWDGTEETLRNDNSLGCKENVSNERAYCTALIKMNGWKNPKDYPIRF